MATEGAEYIAQLVESQPVDSDFVLEGDNELRQLKDVLKKQLPDLEERGITTIIGTETLPDPLQYIWSADGLAAWLTLNWADFAGGSGGLGASFSANKASAATTQEWSSAAVVDWTDMEWDAKGTFDLLNDRHVPDEPGIYNYKCTMAMVPTTPDDNDFILMELRKTLSGGGTSVERQFEYVQESPDSYSFTLDTLVQMDGVGDYVEIWLVPKGGSSSRCFNETERSWFQGLKISELPVAP